jgi:hypothetical protein
MPDQAAQGEDCRRVERATDFMLELHDHLLDT